MATSTDNCCGDELVRITEYDATPDYLDAKVVGDTVWIDKEVVSGTSQTLKIKHIGPGSQAETTSTPTLSVSSNTPTLTAKPVGYDDMGHVTGEASQVQSQVTLPDEKVKTNSSDPASGYLADKVTNGNLWISVGTSNNKVTVSHALADSEASLTYDGIASALINASDQLSITPNQLRFDSRGHQTLGVQQGSAVTVDLIEMRRPRTGGFLVGAG